MAAYAALVSLINNIDQIIAHPRFSKCFDGEQIHSLLQNASSLLEFIEGGSNYEDLEREITSVAHAAEDVVESYVVDQIHVGTTLRSLDLQQVIQDMGTVAGRAILVKEKQGVREKAEQPPPTYPTPHHAGETAMVGLEDELTQLLGSLTNHRSDRHVISIVGMGGTGKTTLAQNIYAHQLVQDHFDIRGWVTISQKYSLVDILSQLLSCLGKSTMGEVAELGGQLHKTLFGKRYLIVLDDIWGLEAWDGVRRYLPDSGNSSRVVLTTRLSNLASDCGSTCLDLNILDDDKSWKLFCEKTLFPLKDDPPQLQDVAKKIVKYCKGLALSIVVIGGLLRNSSRTVEYWENVLIGLETNDDHSNEKQQGLDALFLSYNHLPPHLKPCFLYMGIFKEDCRIRASVIVKFWVTEGFIKPKGTRILEEIGEDHLKDLSDRNLVLGVERSLTGKIKSFSIHDLLRDICIKVGEQQEFFQVWKPNQSLSRTARRVVCHELFTKESGTPLARSFLGLNYRLDSGKHRLLRVFDSTRNDCLDVYSNNVNLRYLNVYKLLSSNIRLVWNLQTLIIEDWYEVVVAPLEIWKMRQLRHVECNRLYLPDSPMDAQDRMEQLQTLRTIVNLRLSKEMCEIIPNIKKLHLVYDTKNHGYDDSLIGCLHNLDRFHKLESLKIHIITSIWPPKYSELISMLAIFPHSLKKLWLSECSLRWEDLSMIGSLPQLQLLHLNFHAVTEGETWRPVGGQFRCLKLLEIYCCDLYSWDVDCSHFPVLEKLLLRGLFNLEEIPLEIGGIPTLGLIRVENCSKSAAISAVRIKKDQRENYDNDALQIEIKVYPYDLESFMNSMEIEDLALNLIKLSTGH